MEGAAHHEYARLFPMLGEQEIQDLADDISAHGLRTPIVIDADGKILDGRNRAAACTIAGVKPTFEPFVGSDEEKLAFVISANIHRRHLDSSQRASVAAKLKPIYEQQAAKRSKATQAKPGQKVGKGKENFPEPSTTSELWAADHDRKQLGQARDKAGAAMNVSGKLVDMAEKVQKKAVPELVAAVDRGEVAVSAAAVVADMPAEKQKALVTEGPKAVRKAAAEVRKAEPEPERRDMLDMFEDMKQLIRDAMHEFPKESRQMIWKQLVEQMSEEEPEQW